MRGRYGAFGTHARRRQARFSPRCSKVESQGRARHLDGARAKRASFGLSWAARDGLDVSDFGLCLAGQAAAEQKSSIETIEADDATYDDGTAKWDLAAMIHAGCGDDRVAKLRRALKPGGIVVVEGFHKDAVPRIGFATGELAPQFKDGFTILRDEVEDRRVVGEEHIGLELRI